MLSTVLNRHDIRSDKKLKLYMTSFDLDFQSFQEPFKSDHFRLICQIINVPRIFLAETVRTELWRIIIRKTTKPKKEDINNKMCSIAQASK